MTEVLFPWNSYCVQISHYAGICNKRLERIGIGGRLAPKKPTLEDIDQSRLQIFRPSMFGGTLQVSYHYNFFCFVFCIAQQWLLTFHCSGDPGDPEGPIPKPATPLDTHNPHWPDRLPQWPHHWGHLQNTCWLWWGLRKQLLHSWLMWNFQMAVDIWKQLGDKCKMPIRPMGEQQPYGRARARCLAQAVAARALHPPHPRRCQLQRCHRGRGGRRPCSQSCHEASRIAQGHPHLPHQVKVAVKKISSLWRTDNSSNKTCLQQSFNCENF